MPDDRGKLNPEDHAKINAWWQGRWRGPIACPICQTSEWKVQDYVVNYSRHARDAYTDGTPSFPMILVTCQTCTNTLSFSAVSMGVTPEYQEAADPLALAPPGGPYG